MITVKEYLTDQKILRSDLPDRTPAISLVLPTHSRCKNGMLERSIKSVLAQTFTDFELIIVDDGSTDGSYDLIESYRAHDPRIVHVRHEHNSGIHSIRLNEGMELARGKYIGFQFDDDALLNNALADLHAEISKHSEPVFVLGRSHFKGPNGQWDLPAVEINLVNLYEQNRFANNAVLFSRELMDRYGMYDCHIGMRRLCDWDLWLRYIKHVPFIVIDQFISRVYESNPGSLGVTVPWDMVLFRYIHDIPRDHLLTPASWHDYEIDSLKIGDVELELDTRKRLYEEQIVPYYLKFRHFFPKVEGFSPSYPLDRKKIVLLAKQSYDTCLDVTLNHYDQLTNARQTYKNFYTPLDQIPTTWKEEADMLLLVRTVEDDARKLLNSALASDRPVGYYLDDDLLHFHEYGPQFSYLAPKTPYHNNMQEIISRVDAVMVTNDFIGSSVRPLNPRVIPHNNAVPARCLPATPPRRDPARPIRIGYVGQSYRIEEFKHIWEGLRQVSEQYGDRLSFEFWGLDVSSLPPLKSPVKYVPFTFSYLRYLENLCSAGFDILITPLFDHPRPRLGKSQIKYYETAVAGALGIFSDVPQYSSLPGDLTCLKVQNTAEAWAEGLRKAIEMPVDVFDQMRSRLIEHVREEYTEVAQIHYHEAAMLALEFHAKTRLQRKEDGRPRIMYVLHSVHFGGAEIQLWRRLHLIRDYGVEPVVVLPRAFQASEQAEHLKQMLEKENIQVEFVEYACFTEPISPSQYCSDIQRDQIRALLERCQPSLVHSVTFIPSFGQICSELGIPHISTQYAIEDSFQWPENYRPDFLHCALVQSDSIRYARRWKNLLVHTRNFVARDMAPIETFESGQHKFLERVGKPVDSSAAPHPIRLVVAGTFQERKQQLETIEAVGALVAEGQDLHLSLHGYTHYFPEYMKKCNQAIEKYNLKDRVKIEEFNSNIAEILKDADVLLSLSTYESFPGAIKDAMASGVLCVATPVGGVSELMIDGVSGIVCQDTSLESLIAGIRRAVQLDEERRIQIVEQARRVSRSELHPQRAASDLFCMYNYALNHGKKQASAESGTTLAAAAPAAPVPAEIEQVMMPSEAPSSSILLSGSLSYMITISKNNWSGLGLIIGTHMRPAAGELLMQLYSESGNLLRAVSINLEMVRDNSWVDFHFPPIRNSAGECFLIRFSLPMRIGNTRISLYEKAPREKVYIRAMRKATEPLRVQLPGRVLYFREWHTQ